MSKFTVITDTREQTPYIFPITSFCNGSIVEGLKTGDYSLIGYQDILTVERKGSVSEIHQNVLEERFDRELERMQEYKWGFCIFEFSMSQVLRYPEGANLPMSVKKKIRINGDFILRRLLELQFKYNTKFLFCDNRENSFTVLNSIFKRVMQEK